MFSFVLSLVFTPTDNLTALFLHRQDRWLLLIGAALLFIVGIKRRERVAPFAAPIWLPACIALLLILICFAGHYWVLASYEMSRDEQMAIFDSNVFSRGQLVQQLPLLWRDHAEALNTLFMYPATYRAAWISAYLPFNAVLRSLVGLIFAPTLTGPLMTGIGLLALLAVVRRIWPQDREVSVVALLLYIGSGQVIVTGMTAYAMPAHLAFNLVWLWLFLRKAWWSDAGALAVGFVAVGLHQPLMHPLFAAPLLFLLLLEKQWSRAIFYAGGYVAIAAFWLWWPGWTWSLVQANIDARQSAGVDYFTRLTTVVLGGDPLRVPEMAANLLRFVAWQHLLLLPLMFLGWRIARRNSLAAALAIGLLATTLVMTVILPYQGHGFGYRYLHGLIGNGILLALYGWKSLGENQSIWRPLFLRTSIAGAAVLLPFQFWVAHAFYQPAAQANARIAATDADYVLIGKDDAPFSRDLVYNPPTLDRSPIRLIAEEMDTSLLKVMCRGEPSVALTDDRLYDRLNAYYSVAPQHTAANRNILLAMRLSNAGCRVERLP